MYIYMYILIYIHVSIYICTCIYICMCIYICIYMYIHTSLSLSLSLSLTHTHTHTWRLPHHAKERCRRVSRSSSPLPFWWGAKHHEQDPVRPVVLAQDRNNRSTFGDLCFRSPGMDFIRPSAICAPDRQV